MSESTYINTLFALGFGLVSASIAFMWLVNRTERLRDELWREQQLQEQLRAEQEERLREIMRRVEALTPTDRQRYDEACRMIGLEIEP